MTAQDLISEINRLLSLHVAPHDGRHTASNALDILRSRMNDIAANQDNSLRDGAALVDYYGLHDSPDIYVNVYEGNHGMEELTLWCAYFGDEPGGTNTSLPDLVAAAADEVARDLKESVRPEWYDDEVILVRDPRSHDWQVRYVARGQLPNCSQA